MGVDDHDFEQQGIGFMAAACKGGCLRFWLGLDYGAFGVFMQGASGSASARRRKMLSPFSGQGLTKVTKPECYSYGAELVPGGIKRPLEIPALAAFRMGMSATDQHQSQRLHCSFACARVQGLALQV